MQKLFNADLLDIQPVERGFIYACKETLPSGKDAVAFYIYNQEIDIFEKIPVLTYINTKFGENGAVIARNLGDFVTCTIVNITNSTTAVSYSDGRLLVLGSAGEIISETTVDYLGNPACSPAANGTDLGEAVALTQPPGGAPFFYDRVKIIHNILRRVVASAESKTQIAQPLIVEVLFIHQLLEASGIYRF